MGTLKPHSNGTLHCSNTVIGTLADDGWAGTARRRLGGLRSRPVFQEYGLVTISQFSLKISREYLRGEGD